jgi:hypothetical protein
VLAAASLPLRPPPSRFWLIRCLAVVLAVHGMLGAYLGVAVAAGMPVCSATGAKTVLDADGEPLPGTGSPLGHECCCTSFFGPAPFLATWQPAQHFQPAPAEPLTLRKFAAQWLAPLSRGPPSLS